MMPAESWPLPGRPAVEYDPQYVAPLPEGYGRWSYPGVFPYKDRVLISHSYSVYSSKGESAKKASGRLKVLPVEWFYGGEIPTEESLYIRKATEPPPAP